jgi:sugar phosphate isomerase/epimerase
MAILTHGGDLSLAPTLRPFVEADEGTVRSGAAGIAALGFRAVQLDGTLAGIRPRELSPRARKDLVALFNRASLSIAGIDLFIPSSHFTDDAQVDRAMAALTAGIELAADLDRVPVSFALDVGDVNDDVTSAIIDAADGHGVPLAMHDEQDIAALKSWLEKIDQRAIGAGLDPAAVLARKGKPVHAAMTLGKTLTVARLCDQSVGDAVRCPVGRGGLEVSGYRVALDLAAGRRGPVVLDVRGLTDPAAAATSAAKAWNDAAVVM